MEEEHLDYLANMNRAEMGDSLKDLMRDHYDLFKPYLGELFHVEANCIYLNLICGVSQTKIGESMGISQYGVSKRVRGGLNKLTHLLKIPERDRTVVRYDFNELLSESKAEILFLYYFLRTFALTARVLGVDPNIVNSVVLASIAKLKVYAQCNSLQDFMVCYIEAHEINVGSFRQLERVYPHHHRFLSSIKESPDLYELSVVKAIRYSNYLEGLLDSSSYGDYTFKYYDKARVKSEENENGQPAADQSPE